MYCIIHIYQVCHRDLKPENLLLTSKGADADVKIADFGLSKIMGEKTMMKRSCGTWAYWAPEILRCLISSIYVCIILRHYVCVCVCVCVFVCMYVCMCILYVCMHISTWAYYCP